LVWFSNAKELLKRANRGTEDGVHIDLALELTKGVLGFADVRHFGRAHAWKSERECVPLQKLGVDALSPEFAAKFLTARLATSRRSLKEFLLDQTRIAGFGNIYFCEALWHAALNPRRKLTERHRMRETPQSNCVRSTACFRMLLTPGAVFREPDW
jgi:formamidopyrimidine-DNA glycosylase